MNNPSLKGVLSLNNSINTNHNQSIKSVGSVRYVKTVKSNNNQYLAVIGHAGKFLPVMEQSYQNSSKELVKARETLIDLEIRK
jgi:hypothetical protein